MTDKLPFVTDKDFTSKLLVAVKHYALAPIEGATGILASDKKDLILSSSRILQSLINLQFYDTLRMEWDGYKEKGRIKDDYQQTEQHHACLQQMLDFLDTDKPDKVRFDFMKKIFLSTATEKVEDRESILPQQYMSIARKMTSGDVLLLSGLYEMHSRELFNSNEIMYNVWIKKVTTHTNFMHEGLIKLHEKNLAELQLIDGTIQDTRTRIRVLRPGSGRLTTLALDLCNFIEGYDSPDES